MSTDVSSLFVAARPSFLEGASRLLDFGNTLSEYNTSLTPAQADFLALRGDWGLIGHDWASAFAEIDRNLDGCQAKVQ